MEGTHITLTPDDQERLARALEFALKAHGNQKRKGTEIPYVSHLLQVAGLVLEFGGTIDQAVAALLHDTVEDCDGVKEEDIREGFSAEVARLVRGCTDTLEGDTAASKSPYEKRKGGYIRQIGEADPTVKLIAACDKLHNLRSIVADLDKDGAQTLDRFTGTPPQTRWYYESVRVALGSDAPKGILREIDALLVRLAVYVPHANKDG